MGWRYEKDGVTITEHLRAQKPHAIRFLKSIFYPTHWMDFPHAYTNMFVEMARHHAYHAGHVFMVTHTVLIVLLIII